MEERHLSLVEACEALGISERTAYRWIKSGKLKAYKPGRDYWIPESAIRQVVEESEVRPKVTSRSSLEPKLFNGPNDERRESKLPEVADLLLQFGQLLLFTWEAQLPARVQADDTEWFETIRLLWRTFGLINLGVLDELGPDGLSDLEGWFARYMDVNAAVHRINAAIQEHSVAGTSSDEQAAVLLEPLAVA